MLRDEKHEEQIMGAKQSKTPFRFAYEQMIISRISLQNEMVDEGGGKDITSVYKELRRLWPLYLCRQ